MSILSIILSGSQTGQTLTDQTTLTPFSGGTIADDISQLDTLTVTLSGARNGTLTNVGLGSYDAVAGVFTDVGSAAAVTADLDGLVFTPTPQQVAPGQTVATGFTISVVDTNTLSDTDSSTSVIATAGTLAPTISPTTGNQSVTDLTTVTPFSGVSIGDLNFGQVETLTVTLSAAGNGALTSAGGGSYNAVAGVFTDTGTAAQVTSDLDGLVFVPTLALNTLGQSTTTTFTVSDTDSAGASTSDNGASVVATAAVLPTISGTVPNQAVNDRTTITPFASVAINDGNAGQTENVTVTLSVPTQGALINLGSGSYDSVNGIYTDSGAASVVTSDLNGLTFVPVPHLTGIGGTTTTHFTISDTDTAGITVNDAATSVVATDVALPTISATTANQALTDHASIKPFAGVVIGDANVGQTETVTVTLSMAGNGVLTTSGGGSYNSSTGIFSDVGSAATVTTDVDNLVFVPALGQTGPGGTTSTGFTISDTNTLGLNATDTAASVDVTTLAPVTLTPTAPNQPVTDHTTITPFAGVVVGDANVSQTETLTVTLSAAGHGALMSVGGGSYNAATGVYTDVGSAATVTGALDGLVFVPTAGEVTQGLTVTTGFTIRVVDTLGVSVSDNVASAIATAVVAPTISNTVANQATTDHASVAIFSGVVIADANAGQTESVTVTLSAAANGVLTNFVHGSYDGAGGVYTDTGSAATVTSDLEGLRFVPTQGQVLPGGTVTTSFSITDSDSLAFITTDVTTSVIATAIPAPTISATTPNQPVTDHATIPPFAGVAISDVNLGQTQTLTVTLSAPADGILTGFSHGSYNAGTGVYTDSGTAAAVTSDLDGLMFVPAQAQTTLGQTITTSFTISDTDTAGASTTDSATSVIATAVHAPTISGTASSQPVTDHMTLTPFSGVVISDDNANQIETVTLTLSAPLNGLLSNFHGSYDAVAGVYTVSGSAVDVTGDLDGLVFSPTTGEVVLGQTVTTGFTISDIDTAGVTATDNATSVVATAVAAPTISNTVPNQAVTDHTGRGLFLGVVIGDLNVSQTETLTVTLSAAGNGILSAVGGGSYNSVSGVYTAIGTVGEVTTDLTGLVFHPTLGQVPLNQTVTTGFTITDTDSIGSSTTDTTTTVISTAIALPTIGGGLSNQPTTDHGTIAPFASVMIGDLTAGQTESVKVTLSAAANGTLTNLGGGSYNSGTGVYTVSGSASTVTNVLHGLLFTPTTGQALVNQTVSTTFTISDTDSFQLKVTDATTSVVATAIVAPTIANTATNQAVTDHATITPFSAVVISDLTAGQTETVTVTPSAAINGMLTNLGGASYDALSGVYTDTGTAAAVTSDIEGWVFVPTQGQVLPGGTVVTSFTISATDTAGLNATDATTSVVATATAQPAIANVVPNQAVTDHATIMPFAGVVIGDANVNQTETVTVTLSTAANGMLTSLGGGSYNIPSGVYTVTGSSATVTSYLSALVFKPSLGQGALGQTVTTSFTISDTDSLGLSTSDGSTSVIATTVALPTISGTTSNQPVNDHTTITPFSSVVLGDLNAGQTENVSVTLSAAANGILTNLGSGSYDVPSGVFTDSGSAGDITSDLEGLVFTPTASLAALGLTTTTGFTISATDTVGSNITDGSTSVVTTAVAAPTIRNTAPNQTANDHTTIRPFASVVIGDLNSAQTQTVTVTLSSALNGVLTGFSHGSYNAGTGVYTDSGSAAAITTDLDGLVFTPLRAQVPVGETVITGFTISDSDTAGLSVTDTTTSVTALAVTGPTISNTAPNQTMTDHTTLTPFAGVVIGDANTGQIERLTVTSSAAGHGTLSNLGNGSYNATTGVFTDSGSAGDVTSDLQGLVFQPAQGQTPLGQTLTTVFTISDTDTVGLGATDNATSVVATTVAGPTITGVLAGQPTSDQATITPFSDVVVADSNAGQTETVTVTLSSAANGTLTNLGIGGYDPTAGIYTATGSASAVTTAVAGLVFNPSAHQVAPGQSVTTSFTISDIDTLAVSTTNSTTSVIATAGTVSPTITGMIAAQPITALGTITPFSGVVIGDLNLGQTESVTVTLSAAANGTLTNLGGGTYDINTGVYTDTGSAAAVTTALAGLVFTSAAPQVAPGQTVTTSFTIRDVDTALGSASNSVTSAVVTAGTVMPTITGMVAGQAISASATITPFSGVVLGDLNFGQTETVTVTLSAAANGTLTNVGGGSYNAITGVYTDIGSAAAVTTALAGLVFNPKAHQVAPGQTVTTSFTIRDTDTAAAGVADSTTSVIATAGTTVPTIANTLSNLPLTDQATIAPFAGVVIGDLNFGQTETVTVTLSGAANGTLTNVGGGSYNPITGVYTDIGSAAAVTTALAGLVFNPTAHQVAPGQTVTTGFTISDVDTASASTTNSTTSVITTAGTVAPTITGMVAGQAISASATATPFANISIVDLNVGQTETVTVTLSSRLNGTLTNTGGGSYNASTGVFTDTGSAASIINDLQALVFNPTARQVAPGQAVTTSFTISDVDTARGSASNSVTTVIATAGTVAPTMTGMVAGQAISASGTTAPFSAVVIGDLNVGQTETVTVTLSAAANGTLTHLGGGTYNVNTGVYTDTGSAAAVTTALAGLVFNPTVHQVAPGQTVTTHFAISDTDTASASVSDGTTSVIATAGTVAPTIIGIVAGQTITTPGTLIPFSGVVIGDLNFGQTETVTVTLSAAANGTLTHPGGGSYNVNTGVYTDTGSAAALTTALRGLVFTPTAHQVAPGQTVVTSFTISDVDTALASATNATTSVIATAGTVAPTIIGVVAGQTITTPGTITPFSAIVIGDLNIGQTETVTVTLSSAANGTLSNLGGGSYDAVAGVYTDTGTAASVTTALDGLVFHPAVHQVAPGQSVTTSFTINDTNTASASATSSATSVITTAGAVGSIVPNDFYGNGTSDILFENSNSGLVLDWKMSNGTLAASIPIAGASVGWAEVGAGDFNGDGTSDILFKNSNSGLVLDWQMSNGTLAASNPIAGASAGWNVIGTGDFNGDGTSDILFQNSDSGLVLDWQMSNGTLVAGNPIAGATFDWKFIGTGDFNGDGTSDILFQNSSSGLVLDWQMSNGAFSQSIPIAGATPNWKEVGIGDFTGNGTDDILFQNSNSGDVLYWEMTNGQFLRSVSVGTAAPGWSVIATGDYTGNGTTGILLQNSGSGQLMDWELANGTLSRAILIAGATPDWKVLG